MPINGKTPMKDYKIAICAPVHIQPSEKWVEAVSRLNVDVIIVDDSNGKVSLPSTWDIYGYDRQKESLGDKYEYWQNFQKSSSCKNFGHYIAYHKGYDIIMGIDSDCIPDQHFVTRHLENLEKEAYGWENPLRKTEWFSRGFPYSLRKLKTALSMGLWYNELDLYGTDRMNNKSGDTKSLSYERQLVAQTYIPLSGMNWATWRENIPHLLFLPNHADYRRHDDIWGGYIFQKQMLEKGERLVYGQPIVYHDTIVVPEEDATEEVGMIRDEDSFFAWVDAGMQPHTEFDWVYKALLFWKSLYV